MQTHFYFRPQDFRSRRFHRIGSLTQWLRVAILAASVQSLIAAPGPVSAVQEALKQEQLFSGETNGVLDENTRTALRNFQVRQGLPITGEIDAGTLQALENSVRTPRAERSAIESVPPAGKTAEPTPKTTEKDRAFLQTLNTQPGRNADTETSPQPPPATEPRVTVTAPPPSTSASAPANTTTAAALATPEPVAEAPQKPEAKPKKSASEKPRLRSAPTVEIQDPPPRVVRVQPGTVDHDAEPLDSHGTRVVRPPKLVPVPTPVTVRRAEPVNPPPRKEGFFDRLFKDHDRDDD